MRATSAIQAEQSSAAGADEAERVIPLRNTYWRILGAAVAALLLAMLGHAFVTESGFQWAVVNQYFFARPVLDGVLVTLGLTGTAMGIGITLGLILAILRMSRSPVFSFLARTYISIFRAVPALVQMIFWFNLAALFPSLSLGVPFGPSFLHFSASSLFTPFLSATLGLGLSESAYMAEIFRGGIASVPLGQWHAASSIGLSRYATYRRVLLPQAMKSVIPPTGNEVIGMLKYTSLASVIAVTELLESVTLIFDRTFQTMPLLMVAALWYVILTTVLTIGQRRIERHFGRGTTTDGDSLARNVWSNIWSRRQRAVVS